MRDEHFVGGYTHDSKNFSEGEVDCEDFSYYGGDGGYQLLVDSKHQISLKEEGYLSLSLFVSLP